MRFSSTRIEEVGVWNYALTSTQIAGIYASADTGPSSSSTPEPASLALLGCGAGGLLLVSRFPRVLLPLK